MSDWSKLFSNNPIHFEDPVFVVGGVDGANAYHRRKHGRWSTTCKVEKAKAVAFGRYPCGSCYPTGDRA